MTLIELVIAIAVSTIILGAAGVFIINSVRSYEFATNAIDLQMESHVMMEQVGAWIMEGNRIEVVDGVTVEMTQQGGSVKEETVDRVLVIYQIPWTADIDRLPSGLTRDENGKLTTDVTPGATPTPVTASKRLIWMQDKKLYSKIINGIVDFDSDVTNAVLDVDEWGNCVCEYMEVFEPIWNPDKATVEIDVTLKAGVQVYERKNEFNVRNEILATPSPTP